MYAGVRMLRAEGLGYEKDGLVIVTGVDLAVLAGQSLAVVGPSGSGKTTLLALLSGLYEPSKGKVEFDGAPLVGRAGPPPGMAVVLQNYGLVSLLTAAENIEVALRAQGQAPAEAITGARHALAQLGLEAQADQPIEELSGGQQQRTAVARALALEPRLLIADEPTAELDANARANVLARMFGVAQEGGALVLATHDPEVAERCDDVLELHRLD
jgi:putative ABC transport system ATP-binding protein